MNPIAFAIRRPLATLVFVVAVGIAGVVGLSEIHANTAPPQKSPQAQGYLDYIGTRVQHAKAYISDQLKSHSESQHEQHEQEQRKVVVTSPQAKDVIITEPFVCQIHSQRHIEVRALEGGYLQEILIKEGQAVKKGDLLFKILPTLYQAKLDAELAEARLAQLELDYSKALSQKKVVSQNEVALLHAKLQKATAKASLAGAELNFTNVVAPFDGIVDRLHEQLGSLIKEGDVLTTLSDNSVMWVYFNVREARYLEYKNSQGKKRENPNQLKLPDSTIELVLADGSKFEHHAGDTLTVEGKFNNETGNIAFRADFPNPDRLLRHGQTGTVLVHRRLKDAVVIPQRAAFDLLDKRYVFVIGEDHVAHQRLITVQNELEDTFVIKSGLEVKDKIVLEGVREVRDGDKVEYEFVKPEDALSHQKFHAE